MSLNLHSLHPHCLHLLQHALAKYDTVTHGRESPASLLHSHAHLCVHHLQPSTFAQTGRFGVPSGQPVAYTNTQSTCSYKSQMLAGPYLTGPLAVQKDVYSTR